MPGGFGGGPGGPGGFGGAGGFGGGPGGFGGPGPGGFGPGGPGPGGFHGGPGPGGYHGGFHGGLGPGPGGFYGGPGGFHGGFHGGFFGLSRGGFGFFSPTRVLSTRSGDDDESLDSAPATATDPETDLLFSPSEDAGVQKPGWNKRRALVLGLQGENTAPAPQPSTPTQPSTTPSPQPSTEPSQQSPASTQQPTTPARPSPQPATGAPPTPWLSGTGPIHTVPVVEPDLTTRGAHKVMTLVFLAVIEAGLLLLANFLGAKIWHAGPIIQDGGVLVFPLIYVASDLLVELYGAKIANRIALYSCILNAIGLVSCLIVNALPALPSAASIDLKAAFGFSARIMFASIVAFIISSLVNNYLFQTIRSQTSHESFWKRSLGSSVAAHAVDAALFNALAFAGRTTPRDFLVQMLCAFAVGLTLETLLNPLAKKIAWHFHRKFTS